MALNLSEKERQMAIQINSDLFAAVNRTPYFSEPMLLTILAEHCFIENKTGKAIDSLRRCLKHLHAGKYRKTPEYEALIELD